jgi:hypothetical protein
MLGLFSTERWRKNRAGYIEAARGCKEALTRPDGFWRYSPDDQRVKDAVGKWVARARRAHAIVMEREPVIQNFVVIDNDQIVQGAAYATPTIKG